MDGATGSPYRLTVHLTALDHLAEGLYSSVAAVLTETVANAWDADAKHVNVDIDVQQDRLKIRDDGVGMSESDINDRFLRVGYRKRDEMDETPGGRPVMGRKGIGKLSLFSLAEVLRVVTKQPGAEALGLRIDYEELRRAMERGEDVYYPDPIPASEITQFSHGAHGTVIELGSLRTPRLKETNPESLRRRLARRFSVVGTEDFQVFVNGQEVTPTDRGDLKVAQYVWPFRGTDDWMLKGVSKQSLLENRLETWSPGYQVTGWIATSSTPRSLRTPEGNLNSLVLLARGRLVHEDILPLVSTAEMSSRYVTGQIQADFLDESDEDDIVTSDRQRLREDEPRVEAVLAIAKKAMNQVAREWLELRSRDKGDDLRARFPGIDDWLSELEGAWRTRAEQLLQKVCVLELENEEDRSTLTKHAILGFERLRLRGAEEELERALDKGVDALLKLFADRDTLEASYYHDIVKSRVEVIKSFENIVDENKREKILQNYLFDHLWLLDPGWERATGSEAIEKQLRLKKPFAPDEKTKQEYGRVDIRYRTVAGKHVIVELKRASVRPRLADLLDQGGKYVDALRELLIYRGSENPSIEVIFVVGKMPEGDQKRITSVMEGVSPGSRILTFEQLIMSALNAYDDYLRAARDVDTLERVLASSGASGDAGEGSATDRPDVESNA